jgi:hypothetical protein
VGVLRGNLGTRLATSPRAVRRLDIGCGPNGYCYQHVATNW